MDGGTSTIVLADTGMQQQVISPGECTRTFYSLRRHVRAPPQGEKTRELLRSVHFSDRNVVSLLRRKDISPAPSREGWRPQECSKLNIWFLQDELATSEINLSGDEVEYSFNQEPFWKPGVRYFVLNIGDPK